MFTDKKTIEKVLSHAQNIYYIENGEKVMLVYNDWHLIRTNPFGGLAYKSVSEVSRVMYNNDLDAWQVFFKDSQNG